MTMLLLPPPHEARDESSARTPTRASLLPRVLRLAVNPPRSLTPPAASTAAPAAAPTTTPTAVPCAARPGTQLRHLDGPCECFFGGSPPEFAPSGGTPV